MTRPADGSSGGSGVVLDAVSWKGPYFRTPNDELPIDPMTGNNTWSYTSATGALASTSTLTAINGEPYNTW